MWHKIFQGFKESSEYIKSNEGFSLLVGAIVLSIVLYILQYRRKVKLPPGPVGLPILGYYPFLRKNPQKALDEVAKKYGNVVGLYIGPQYVVFLNDWEAVKDALSQNATADRPSSLFAAIPFNLGFSVANGSEWIQTRRLALRAMKDIGLHSNRWEELVQEEVLELVDCIKLEGQRPVEVRSFFSESFANSIMTLALGQRLYNGHSITKSVVESVDAIIEHSPTLGMSNFSLTLTKILQLLGLEKKFSVQEKLHELADCVSNIVDEKLRNLNSGSDDSFIVRFQEEIQSHHKNKENTYITEETLKGTVITLLTGGSESGRTTTIWALIAMADHPGIQKKVHEELDRVIGKVRTIRWSERFKIPYTFAALLESMRWKTVAPLPAARIAAEDTQLQGYHIPKGTFLITNNWAIHNDPRYWDNPDRFKPERFLEDDGKKVNASPESFNAFSYGKRNCPGKLIALMENLQYFSILMQKFKVLPKEGDKVKYDTMLGITHEATNVELRFIQR